MDEPRIRMESDNKNAECKKAAGDQLKAKENEWGTIKRRMSGWEDYAVQKQYWVAHRLTTVFLLLSILKTLRV